MNSTPFSTLFINKIPQTNSICNLIFKSQWHSTEINLQILDSHHSKEWEGSISIEEIKKSADELEIPYEQFYDECKEAITRNGGANHFEYSMENNKFTLTKNDQFRIQYLEVDMKQDYDLQETLTLNAVDLISSLREELSSVRKRSAELNHKYQAMVKALDARIEEKNHIETRLLQKFSILLNTKKDKIAELQDLLVEKENRLEEAGLSAAEPNKRKSSAVVGNSIDDDDDFMQATQVMTQPVVTLPKRKKLNTREEIVPKGIDKETAEPSISGIQINKVSPDALNVTVEDSADIFDQIF